MKTIMLASIILTIQQIANAQYYGSTPRPYSGTANSTAPYIPRPLPPPVYLPPQQVYHPPVNYVPQQTYHPSATYVPQQTYHPSATYVPQQTYHPAPLVTP